MTSSMTDDMRGAAFGPEQPAPADADAVRAHRRLRRPIHRDQTARPCEKLDSTCEDNPTSRSEALAEALSRARREARRDVRARSGTKPTSHACPGR